MSFSARLMGERKKLVYLLQAQPEQGASSWCYLAVEPLKRAAFLRAVEAGHVEYAAFGEVLSSGLGAEPPAHIVWALQQDGLI